MKLPRRDVLKWFGVSAAAGAAGPALAREPDPLDDFVGQAEYIPASPPDPWPDPCQWPPRGLVLSLHTEDPRVGSEVAVPQGRYETTYPGYERIVMPTDRSGWEYSQTQDTVSNADELRFPECVGGSYDVRAICMGDGTEVLHVLVLALPILLSGGVTAMAGKGQIQLGLV